MSINTDFYGNENDWIAISNDRFNVKKPAWTNSATASTAYGSLDTLVRSPLYNPDNKATVPLDSSIIPWKVNENSKVFRRKYCELSFPNRGGSDPPAIIDYFNQSANYKESENFAIKNLNGFRFFVAYYTVNDNSQQYIENAWVRRYSPYNYKNEFLDGTSGTQPYKNIFPLVSFDYSRTVATVEVALIPKIYLDNSVSISSDASINKYYDNRTPDYNATYKSLSALTDDDLTNNYLVGFLFNVYSGGDSSTAGLNLTIIPIDEHLAVPANEWGGTTGQGYPYQSDFTCYTSWVASSINRVRYCQLGGATSYVNPANCGVEGAEPATYNAQYYETKGMRTMNTEDFEGEGLEVGSWTIITNTKSGSLPNGRVISWFIPKCYNNLTVAQIRTAIFKELAYLGFWFTDDVYYARYVDMTNHPEKYYLPEIDSMGVTTGNYKAYSEATEESNFDWNTNIYNKTPYNPENDNADDPNTYDNNTTNLNYIRNIGAPFGHEYIMTQQQVIDLRGDLYSTITTDIDSDIWSQQNFFVNNPMDVIKSLMFFPFDILTATGYTGSIPIEIVLGKVHMPFAKGISLPSDVVVIDLGKCTYFPYFGQNDFRNFKPYSSAELFIPYCGTVEIDPELFMNQEISVKMLIDLKTGSCLSLIYRNNMVVDFATGQIGISVPISGIQAQTLASAERQAQSQLKMARISALTNVANIGLSVGGASMTGGLSLGALPSTISGLMNNYENIENAKYNLEHINTPYKSKGTSTALTSFVNEQQCRLVIKRPVMDEDNLQEYSHNNGYAVLKNDTLNNFTGFTKCDTADLSGINCTKSEKNLIMNYLKNGVYL